MKNQEYNKVYNDLKSQILKGCYTAGEKLAPERQLCNDYKVSRITARHALRLLEEDALVERFQGKGTFIKNIKPAKLPITDSGFAKSCKEYAPGLYRELLKYETVRPPSNISDFLGLDGDNCFLAMRADVLENEIIAFDKAYIRLEHCKSITEKLLKQVDFFEKWQEKENIKIVFYDETIEAIEANSKISSLLKVRRSKSILKSTEIYYDGKNNPIGVFESYYRGDKIKLTSTVRFKDRK